MDIFISLLTFATINLLTKVFIHFPFSIFNSPFNNMANLNFSQAELANIADMKLGFLTADIIDFQSFDAFFDATYLTNFAAAIQNVRAFPEDESVLDILGGLTQKRDEVWNDGKKAYQKLKYFVELAFPNQSKIHNEFGFDDYGESSKRVEYFIQFLYKTYMTAQKYASKLALVNYSATQIQQFLTLHEDLKKADYEQEAYKNERQQMAAQRNELIDILYNEYVARVNKAGKIVYMDNTAKYVRYLLPSRSTSSSPKPETVEKQERKIAVSQTAENEYYSLQVTGDTSLQFYIAPSGATAVPVTAISVSPSNSSIDYSALDLGFDIDETLPQALFAFNPNQQSSSFLVEKLN